MPALWTQEVATLLTLMVPLQVPTAPTLTPVPEAARGALRALMVESDCTEPWILTSLLLWPYVCPVSVVLRVRMAFPGLLAELIGTGVPAAPVPASAAQVTYADEAAAPFCP